MNDKIFFNVLSGFWVIFFTATMIFSTPATSAEDISVDVLGVAIKGYDPVAYFTEGDAVKGSEKFVYYWNEAEWHFSSAVHRDLFAAEPERYAPNHGGF